MRRAFLPYRNSESNFELDRSSSSDSIRENRCPIGEILCSEPEDIGSSSKSAYFTPEGSVQTDFSMEYNEILNLIHYYMDVGNLADLLVYLHGFDPFTRDAEIPHLEDTGSQSCGEEINNECDRKVGSSLDIYLDPGSLSHNHTDHSSRPVGSHVDPGLSSSRSYNKAFFRYSGISPEPVIYIDQTNVKVQSMETECENPTQFHKHDFYRVKRRI